MLKKCIILLFLILGILPAAAQNYQCDTLELKVFFRRDKSDIDASYMDNAASLADFNNRFTSLLADSSAVVRHIIIQTSASPEGSTSYNQRLSESRAQNINDYLTRRMGMDPYLFRFNPIGEDWEGLERILTSMSAPPHWVSEAIDIIRNSPDRKERLKKLDDGKAWAWMDENIFPRLRAAGGSVTCIIQRPFKVTETVNHTDTVYISITNTQVDTVYTGSDVRPRKDFSGRHMMLAARTNVLAVPFANVGVEIPLGSHWSVGADWYYPWIWRDDVHRACTELLAWNVEARYWFRKKEMAENRRLIGHSVGIYGGGGHYDFQRNWSGHQGRFINVGVDYLYALPILKGRMHLEFEIGFGYLRSVAQPYNCFEIGGNCYRQKDVLKYIHWVGPTRVQANLVLPIYRKEKGGAE